MQLNSLSLNLPLHRLRKSFYRDQSTETLLSPHQCILLSVLTVCLISTCLVTNLWCSASECKYVTAKKIE